MNVLLALSLALLQENPEEAFHKIEAAIERAREVRVLFTVTTSQAGDALSRGTFSMDGETKLKMSADIRNQQGDRISIWTEFQNGQVKASVADRVIELKVEGKQARSNFNTYLSRLGIFTASLFEYGFWSGSARGGKGLTVDLKQIFGLKDFVAVGDGKNGTRILSYNFSAGFNPMPFRWSKIWYDPRTYRIVRREVLWENKGKEETIIEEYEYQGGDEKTATGPSTKPVTGTTGAPKSEAEQDLAFIQARIQVANEHLTNGRKQKAIDVLEDLALSFKKHALAPEINRLLEEARKK